MYKPAGKDKDSRSRYKPVSERSSATSQVSSCQSVDSADSPLDEPLKNDSLYESPPPAPSGYKSAALSAQEQQALLVQQQEAERQKRAIAAQQEADNRRQAQAYLDKIDDLSKPCDEREWFEEYAAGCSSRIQAALDMLGLS